MCREKNVAKYEGPQSQAEKDYETGDSICVKTTGELHRKAGAVSAFSLPQHVRKDPRWPCSSTDWHLTPAVAMPSPKDTDNMCNLHANGAVEVVLLLGNKC